MTGAADTQGIVRTATSDVDLQLIVRTGDLVVGTPLLKLSLDLSQLDMSESGVAWIGDFPTRSSAIGFSSLPRQSFTGKGGACVLAQFSCIILAIGALAAHLPAPGMRGVDRDSRPRLSTGSPGGPPPGLLDL